MRYWKWAAFLMVLALGGCSQLSGIVDGATGADITTTDSPTWYHLGTVLVPFVSGLAALVRRFFAGGINGE